MGAKTSVAESCIDFRRVRGAGRHFLRKNDDHAEFAALGFSVSLWRQISSGFWGVVLERDPPTIKWCDSYQTFWLVSFHGCVVAPGRAQICIRTAEPRKQLLVGV